MLTGAVLAGGRSSRMGRDKALLEYQGQSLQDRAVAVLQSAGCEQVLVSRNQPGFVQDTIPDKGPLGAIHSLLSAAPQPTSWLIMPVDMPGLTAKSLQLLLQAGAKHQQPCYFASSFLPLYLPDAEQAIQAVNCLLEQNRLAIKDLLGDLHARALPCPSETELVNMNYPGDWQRFSRQSALS